VVLMMMTEDGKSWELAQIFLIPQERSDRWNFPGAVMNQKYFLSPNSAKNKVLESNWCSKLYKGGRLRKEHKLTEIIFFHGGHNAPFLVEECKWFRYINRKMKITVAVDIFSQLISRLRNWKFYQKNHLILKAGELHCPWPTAISKRVQWI